MTAQPNRISVALNKGNFTTELIQRSGKFTASDFVKVTVAEPDASTTNKYAGTRTEKNLEAAFAGESMARNCGHIVIGTEAPDVCPVCFHPQAYFEINAENY